MRCHSKILSRTAAAAASTRPMVSTRDASIPQPKRMNLEITVVSAKHLENVNWRYGDLNAYAVVYIDPDVRLSTMPDDTGNTKPVWNKSLFLSVPNIDNLASNLLTIDLFHSRLSNAYNPLTCNPLIGTARCPLSDLIDTTTPSPLTETFPIKTKTLDVRRPSGRPQGKIRIRICIRDRHAPPPLPSCFPTFPVPHPPPQDQHYVRYSPSQYAPQYPYMSIQDPFREHDQIAPVYYATTGGINLDGFRMPPPSYYGGPSSSQVDFSPAFSPYHEQKQKEKQKVNTVSSTGAGSGLAGALGGLTLEEVAAPPAWVEQPEDGLWTHWWNCQGARWRNLSEADAKLFN